MFGLEELSADGVSAVLGPSASSEVAAIAPQVAGGRTLTISPSATSPALGSLDYGGNFYRLAPSDAVQSTVSAQLIDAAALDHLCIVFRDDAYGRGIHDAVAAQLASGVVVTSGSFTPNAPDFQAAIDACGPPDRSAGKTNGILFVTLISDGAAAIDAAATTWGPSFGDRVFLTDGTRDADLVTLLAHPDFIEGAVGTASRGPDPDSPDGAEAQAFRARFQDVYMRPSDVYSEMAYDAVYVIAMAFELAGTADDIEPIRAALAKISVGTQVSAGDWSQIADEIRRAGQLDYRGASGAVTLSPPSIEVAGPYYIDVWKVIGGVPTSQEIRTVNP
jgi:branched-chain amino acid transport system substrate-binding protein